MKKEKEINPIKRWSPVLQYALSKDVDYTKEQFAEFCKYCELRANRTRNGFKYSTDLSSQHTLPSSVKLLSQLNLVNKTFIASETMTHDGQDIGTKITKVKIEDRLILEDQTLDRDMLEKYKTLFINEIADEINEQLETFNTVVFFEGISNINIKEYNNEMYFEIVSRYLIK